MDDKKVENYRDLKNILNSLTEEQLDKKIMVASDENPTFDVSSVWILEEDHINNGDGELEPISNYNTDPDFEEEEYPIVLKKDSVILLGISEDYEKMILNLKQKEHEN